MPNGHTPYHYVMGRTSQTWLPCAPSGHWCNFRYCRAFLSKSASRKQWPLGSRRSLLPPKRSGEGPDRARALTDRSPVALGSRQVRKPVISVDTTYINSSLGRYFSASARCTCVLASLSFAPFNSSLTANPSAPKKSHKSHITHGQKCHS